MRPEPLGDRAGSFRERADLPSSLIVERAAVLLAVAAAYFVASKLGFALTLSPNPISILWPPNALLLAVLLQTPPPRWWPILAAVFPAHLLAQLSVDVPMAMALSWFATNCFEALLGATLSYGLLQGPPRLERFRDVCVFLVCCVGIAPFLTAFLDIGAVRLNGWGEGEFWPLWRMRFFSNALAMLILVPVILSATQWSLRRPIRASWRQVEAIVLALVLLSLCAVVFSYVDAHYDIVITLTYCLLPILLLAAMRFNTAYVSNLILVMTLAAIWGTQHDRGPLIFDTPAENALALQLFLMFTAAPLLLLGALLGEWRRAEAQARSNEEQLNMALRAARMRSWNWDVRAMRVHWSTGSLPDFVDFDCKANLESFLRLVHPADRAKVEAQLNVSTSDCVSFEIEFRALRVDGSYGWIASRGMPRFDEKGEMVTMVGVNSDITERRAEAAQIRQQRDELAHLSRVAMVGELSGAVAHELNQPLTAILCNAQAAQRLLRRQSPSEIGLEEILHDIVAENKRAGEIIRRLRELLKKGEVQLLPVDINGLVREVIVLEHSDLVARNIAVTTQLQRDVPMALADRVQVQQVLLNLIINAADAMHDNCVSERLIAIRTSLEDDRFARIAVRDCGPGIAAEPPDQIFEPFYTTKAHGLGLGLTICRSIVNAHGGRLWAKNNEEGGATLMIDLPLAED